MKGLGWLSEQAESGGDPAAISSGRGDSGGISYGKYQFSSNMGVVQNFVEWLQNHLEPYGEYGRQLAQYEVNSEEFKDKWRELAEVDHDGFSALQDEFSEPKYFDSGATNLWEQYCFDIHQHSFALRSVLFSNCIQHGSWYGAEVFQDANNLFNKTAEEPLELNDMTDAQIIENLYEVKLTDMSWSSGAPDQRPGLFARWERERAIALQMFADGVDG